MNNNKCIYKDFARYILMYYNMGLHFADLESQRITKIKERGKIAENKLAGVTKFRQ